MGNAFVISFHPGPTPCSTGGFQLALHLLKGACLHAEKAGKGDSPLKGTVPETFDHKA